MELSRRRFLGLGGAAVATGTIAMLAGCSPNKETSTPAESSKKPEGKSTSYLDRDSLGEASETLETDFVICGAGGTGLAAALEANELGLDVILLEKQSVAGGNFGFSELTNAVGAEAIRNRNNMPSLDGFTREVLQAAHYIPQPKLLRTIYSNVPDTIDWVQKYGCEFDPNLNAEIFPTALFYKGDTERGAGFTFIEALAQSVEKAGIKTMFKTPAKELVIENGKVVGVKAVDDKGTIIQIRAAGVLLATGGYGSNTEMLEELGKVNPEKVVFTGYEGHDGDGIIMGQNAGATLARSPENIMFYGPFLPGTSWGKPLWAAGCQGMVWVNQDAERFIDESTMNLVYRGLACRDLSKCFVLLTQGDVDEFTNVGLWQPVSGHTPPATPLPIADELKRQIDSGNECIFVADTIEDLAKKCGLDDQALRKTIDTYNEYVRSGIDLDFNKPAAYMRSYAQGPYYAFDSIDAFYTTVGGLRINESMQVVGEDGQIIKGLYAGGCDAGGMYGDAYDFGSAPGSQSSFALNSGRLAAKHVASLLK